jgi:large repetitive protein
MMNTATLRTVKLLLTVIICAFWMGTDAIAQFPGCPSIDAGPDQTLPCSTPCTNLTAAPFHTGATTTYTVSSIPHAPPIAYNATGGTAVSVGTDDVWSPVINLPFNFCFYGVNYTSIKVGSNGAIDFGPAAGGGTHPWAYTASCPSPALTAGGEVFGVYHDIDPTVAGSVRWYLLGTAPCRIFVVAYNNLGHYSCTSLRSTHMMVLYETTNVIDVYVQNKSLCTGWNGGAGIIGIQNPTGTAGIAAPGRNTTPTWSVTTPEGWRFTPNGTPNYSVAWFQGATQIGTGNTVNVCPTGTTTYTSVITYNRCDGTVITAQDQVTVNFSSLTPPTVTPAAESCSNYNNGSVVIDNPPGAGPYTVNITGPASGSVVEANTAGATASFTNLPDGTYNYTVTGANGCTTTGTFTIAPGPVCCSVTASGTNIACSGGTSGTATATPVGLAPYTYSWTGGQTTQTASNIGAGSYTVTMTDASGCVATANVTITQPPALTGTLAATNVSCNGACNGSISVTASGGTPPYQYSINGGTFQTGTAFTALCNGTYAVTIRDANNCTAVINQNITQPPALTLTQGTLVPTTCGANNGSATVSAGGGTAPYSYSIDGGAGQTGTTFNGLAAGPHTIVVTDSHGCTQTITVTITSTNAPVASVISQNNVSCFGGVNGSVIIGISGGTAPFSYTIGGPSQPSNTFTNIAAGTYTATVTDANGCSATVNFTITSPPQLTYTTAVTPVACNGQCNGQIQVNASGGTAPYTYSANNGVTYSTVNPITGLCAGAVNLVVQDANGCLSNSTVNITQPAPVSATFVNTPPTCNGVCNGQITVTPSGGTPAYQYSVNSGPLQPANVLTGICGGNTTVLVQDSHGCQFTSVQNIVQPAPIVLNVVNVIEANCGFNNGSITVSASGPNAPFLYSFEGGPFGTATTFSNLYGGAYQITVQNALGCTQSVFVGVNDIEMDGIVLIQTDATCYGTPNGTIEVTNVSGALPIIYELDNNGSTQSSGFFDNLAIGSHVVTVYDGGNCVFTLPFMVYQPTELSFQNTTVPVACNGGNTGQINFTNVTGGTGAYQYSVNGGTTFQASPNFTGLAAGTYNVQVMDANNCVMSASVTVTQSPALAITTTVFDLACNGDNSGAIQIGVTGGTPSYTYSIDNGATFGAGESFFSLAAGTYSLAVQDAAGCQATGTATVNQPAVLTANYTPTAALCNGSCDGQIAVTAAGGTAPYLYSPDNGSNYFPAATLTDLCAGNVTVLVKDAHNCTVSSVQAIAQPAALTLAAAPTNETCSASNGQIAVTAGGGTPGYTYSIDNGTTFQPGSAFTGLPAATYNVFIEDVNGCQENTTAIVNNEASPVIIGAAVQNVSCNAACDGTLTVTVSGGTGAITYSIGTPQAGSAITGICAGSYTLTIEDANGCTDTQPVTVTEPAVLTATATPTALTCYQNNTGEIDFAASGGTAPYSYSINNGATYAPGQTNFGFLSAGTYNTIVRDAHNCTVAVGVIITEPAELLVQSTTENDASCHGFCDGDASVTMTGGTAPYSYTWSEGTTGANAISGLCAGTYDAAIEDANGCQATQQFNITEPPMLVIVSSTATDALCNGDCNGTISINSPLATGYSVDNGSTFQGSNTFNGLCANTYQVVVQDQFGCTQPASLTVAEPQPLVLDPIPEDGLLICYDGYGTLSGNATGGTGPYYYVWNTGDTVQYLNVNLTSPATFTCTVTDQNGCVSNSQSADVQVRPMFVPSVTTPVYACPGQAVSMTGSGVDGLPGYTFEWLTPTHDTLFVGDSYNYTPAGSETVLMVSHDQCYRYDTLPVAVQIYSIPSPDFDSDPVIGCAPLNATLNFAQGVGGSIADAQWSFGDGTGGSGTTDVTHVYTEVGCYDVTVQVTTTDGCVTDTTIMNAVCVAPDPVANFGWNPSNPTNVNSSVTFQDQSTGAEEYDWNFGDYGVSSLQNPSVQFSNVEAGTYNICLRVTSDQGCIDEVCKPITFLEEFLIYVPNTFTPDGDEYNNEFTPVVPPGMPIDDYTLTIFNRWGEVLFESHDISVGWDGSYANQQVKEGVYVWRIVARGGGDKKLTKMEGHVTLLK